MKVTAMLALCAPGLLASPAFAALVVSKGATSGVTCASGVCTATASDAVLNQKDFRHMIGAGDLTLVSGGTAQDIVIDAKIHWTKAHHLTLDSYRGISFLLELASEGGGGVTLKTNDGGTGGALTFVNGKGTMTFWDTASSLAINGVSYTLANNVQTLAADIAANPSGAFAFGRAYDASADGTYNATPIATPFSGTFNGLGHTIGNLTISDKNRLANTDALFAQISSGGSASNFALDTASITSNSRYGFAAMFASVSQGMIDNVSASGAITLVNTRSKYVAGLVGENEGTISRSHTAGTVTCEGGCAVAAGLVGLNEGTIINTSSSAAVTGSKEVCGLVGLNEGTVTLSSSSGSAKIGQPKNDDTEAGGLVCTNFFGTISQSFSTAVVYAAFGEVDDGHFNAYGGGLAVDCEPGSPITDSYATGPVSADYNYYLGGLAADSRCQITTSWSSGAVSAPPAAGGLIGLLEDGTQANTYWDLSTSGISDPSHGADNVQNAPGITGLTTAQFQSGLPAGFDPAIWAESPSINGGYPYLIANPPK
jgi:hypothetical protein